MQDKLVIGMDFGTDSARGLLINPQTTEVLATAVCVYKRWSQGLYCIPEKEQYRQHPLDYMEAIDDIFTNLFVGLEPTTIKKVVAIGTNTTGSTPVAVDSNARPLALSTSFADNPNAMFVLWKDHTAKKEAMEINSLAKIWPIDYTLYSGGIYSSEWFWSKMLHVNREDENVRKHTFTWVEQSDWIPSYLAGISKASKIKRNRCAAGHKAMWNESYGGLPSAEFLCALDPTFYHFVNRFYTKTYTSDEVCGNISSYFVEKYGFDPSTIVTIGAIDAHHGAVGAGSHPYSFVKVIGTSTCDMLVIPKEDNPPIVPGICGQVDGSIDPGMIGFEAGQSAFGDIYNWYKNFLLKPIYSILEDSLTIEQQHKLEADFFDYMTKEAQQIKVAESTLVFTDFFNGRRTPDADFNLLASATGFNLATNAGQVFKALVEATAFGSKAIIDRFISCGIPIKSVIATGGIPNKSPYVVQVLADVLGCDIDVVDSNQTCALGSAIFAAVAAGVYATIADAKQVLSARILKTYTPNIDNKNIYDQLYHTYNQLTLTLT